MEFIDPVYGSVRINEPVIIELINSQPVQRLKKITQHGAAVYNKYYDKKILTRYEHSVGVFLFLNKFNCSLEEQIAGLLHDVGHTVFSHVIDYIFVSEHQDYDKKNQRSLILESEIPEILDKYNINLDYVLSEENFPILEKNLPDLCADRIDYCLRDPHFDHNLKISKILSNLRIVDKNIIFSDENVASTFAEEFMRIDKEFWANYYQQYLYHLLAESLKISLDNKYLVMEDLYKTEDVVMKKMHETKDIEIDGLLKELENVQETDVFTSDIQTKDGYGFTNKPRTINPLIKASKGVVRLTDIDSSYQKRRGDYIDLISRARWIARKDGVKI